MKQIKTWLTAITALLCSTAASAHDFEVDGVYYKITSEDDLTVEVTYKGDSAKSFDNEYSREVLIDYKVSYEGKSYKVTSIGNSAFAYCTDITNVYFSATITSIGDSAFFYCTGLTSFIIPSQITSIGNHAFRGCTGLTSITFWPGVTSIGEDAFYDCTSLTGVYIRDISSWNKISFARNVSNPLYYAKKLYLNGTLVTDLIIPDSETSIGNHAFAYCTELTSVTIPKSVTSIGKRAFLGCTGLTSITIPEGVTSIGDYAFAFIPGLTSWCKISFYNSFSNPLYYAKNLYLNGTLVTDLVIPDSVTSIGYDAFYECI